MNAPMINTSALYEQVAELIRQRIFNGELAPGSWIDESQLANAYGISRTPLREALKVLASEGLVTMKLRRGAYVTEVAEKDLQEVYHLLGLLEADAAAELAEKATEEEIQTLKDIHQTLEQLAQAKQPDVEQFFTVNQRFHQTVLSLAGNHWRQTIVNDLRKVMKLSRQQSLLKTGRIQQSLDEHRHLMQAISARDASQSRACMLAHFHNGLRAAI